MYKLMGNHCKNKNTVYFPNCQTGGGQKFSNNPMPQRQNHPRIPIVLEDVKGLLYLILGQGKKF